MKQTTSLDYPSGEINPLDLLQVRGLHTHQRLAEAIDFSVDAVHKWSQGKHQPGYQARKAAYKKWLELGQPPLC